MSYLCTFSLRRMVAVQTIRVAPIAVRSLHTQYQLSVSRPRYFSSSPKREATPHEGQSFLSALKTTPLYKEIAEKPAVLQAAKELIEVLQAEGFGMDPNNPPSAMRLFMNAKVRKQMMQTVTVFKENGVDTEKLQETMKALQNIRKIGGS
ncbi:hypothetical protein QCA50_001277 [Cerrena zonata]|uniref:Uncharacterized protein n=1 Tax=Cerrena zonata TaxID=2478898 RepID=A0AAW0GYG9_9APHY